MQKNENELETLIHAVRIYSQDVGMEFGIENCAMLVMKSGKRRMTEKIELPVTLQLQYPDSLFLRTI